MEGEKVGASEATLLNMLKIYPFSYGLEIEQGKKRVCVRVVCVWCVCARIRVHVYRGVVTSDEYNGNIQSAFSDEMLHCCLPSDVYTYHTIELRYTPCPS